MKSNQPILAFFSDELLSRFEQAKPKPTAERGRNSSRTRPEYHRTRSSHQLQTFENDDGSYSCHFATIF